MPYNSKRALLKVEEAPILNGLKRMSNGAAASDAYSRGDVLWHMRCVGCQVLATKPRLELLNTLTSVMQGLLTRSDIND